MNKLSQLIVCTTLMLFLVPNRQQAQTGISKAAPTIQWMDMQTAIQLSKTHPKKMMIDVYTDWCGWCKKMDAGTFKDSAVVAYINANFYAVKFNAERKDTLYLKEKAYTFNPNYRSNELAAQFLRGKMGYPTVVFLDEEMKRAEPVPGFQNAPDFLLIAQFFGSNAYLIKGFEDFKNGK